MNERRPAEADEVLRMVLDDETVRLLRSQAERRGMVVEELMVALLTVGVRRVDDLLNGDRGNS